VKVRFFECGMRKGELRAEGREHRALRKYKGLSAEGKDRIWEVERV
jgi:hypothetical protein